MRHSFSVFLLLFCSTVWAGPSTKAVDYSYGGEVFEGYAAMDDKTKPTVFLIHDWDGLTDYEIKRSKMLLELGYNVFALDLFGKGVRPTKVEDKRQHTGELYKDRKKMRAIMQAGYEKAKTLGLDVNNSVAIGYCFGGASILEWARSPMQLKGFVSLHGGLDTPAGQDYSATKGQVLILHGAADSHISMEQFADLAKELEQAKVDYEMIAYGGAPHAFTVFGSDRYRKDADKKSWQRLQAFLKANL